MNLRKIGVVFLAVFIFACRFLQAREKSDVIVMKNGDKITCEVKGLSSNTLYISVDYILNTISVDWTKVDHIDSKTIVSGPNTKRRRLCRGAREPGDSGPSATRARCLGRIRKNGNPQTRRGGPVGQAELEFHVLC